MWAKVVVVKVDNGYNGRIVKNSERGLYRAGDVLFNRQLHYYSKGRVLLVTINFTRTGRRMVKYVTDITEKADEFASPADIAAVSELPKAEPKVKKEKAVKTVTTVEGVISVKPVSKPKAAVGTEGYYISPEARLVFNTALGMSRSNPEKAVKMMMVGPSGYGKTTLPRLFAELTGKRFMRMNCATIRDPEEWFGFREARDGSTVFIRSEFAKAIEQGDLVVVLDEFNRLEPWLHNTLFPLLDDDGCTVVHDEEFRIGSGVIVVGTINSGYKFTGTFELDEALMNRFDFLLEVDSMPHHDEVRVLTTRTGIDRENASNIVKLANTLRQNDVICSTRSTLLIAATFCAGMTLREAFETAVVRRIPADVAGSNHRKKVVDLVNVALGPFENRTLSNDLFTVSDVTETVRPALASDKIGVVATITIRSNAASPSGFNVVLAASWIHRLSIPETSGAVTVPSIGESQRYALDVRNGSEVQIELAEIPAGHILEGLRAAGATGVVVRR